MCLNSIYTNRLILIPVTLDITKSLLQRNTDEIEKLGITTDEALKAIMDWAISQNSVKVIKADCLISNIPSALILEEVGMKEINRDKDLTYWEFIK